MRTWTKIDKWRLARLKCQIRTMLRRLFYANSCRDTKVQKEFGGTVERTVVIYVQLVFCQTIFVLLMFWFVRACKCLHSEHLFLFALPFFLSFPATSYTFCMYTFIYIYIFLYVFLFYFFFFCFDSPEFSCSRGTFLLHFFCYLQQLPTSCAHQNGNCATCTKCDW